MRNIDKGRGRWWFNKGECCKQCNGNVLGSTNDYEDQHGGYDFGIRDKAKKSILEFYASREHDSKECTL